MKVSIIPAYGRDYKTIAAVLKDFNRNWDFISNTYSWPDKPVDRQTLIAMGIETVFIRYSKLTKEIRVNVQTGKQV